MKTLITIVALVLCQTIYAQDYKKMMNDTNANFYDIQKAFYKYWNEKETIEEIPDRDKLNEEEESEGEYFQFKRWEGFMKSRVYPSGKLINPTAKAFEAWQLEKNELSNNTANKVLSTNAYWSSAGLTSYNANPCNSWAFDLGRINCIAFDPVNSNIIYCGTPAGGLWKNSNNGSGTWTPLTDGIPQLGVSGIAIDPNNTNVIYILTGDGDGNDTQGYGVLKTENGGTTWFSTGTIPYFRGYKLLMDPTNSNILFAITNYGIYRTVDGGQVWTNVKSAGFFDCEFNPGNHMIMYATTSSQYWRSTDNGVTWTQPSNLPCCVGSNRMAIAVSAFNSNYVYALYAGGNGTSRLYRSTDNGITFNLRSKPVPEVVDQFAYALAINVNPVYPNTVYIGGLGLTKSIDGGANFNTTTPTHVDYHAIEFNGSTMYIANDGGIYKTIDGGTTFTKLTNGMEITEIYSIKGTPQNSNFYCYGAQDNGSNLFDDATNINKAIKDGDGTTCLIDYTNPNIIFTTTQNGSSLNRSDDGGCTSINISISPTGGNWVIPFIMNPLNPSILYAGYSNIYKSNNGGDTWTTVLSNGGEHNAMAIGTNNTNYVYAVDTGNVVRKTINGGIGWSIITGSLPVASAYINCIEVSTIDANKAWVGFGSYSNGIKVFETTDGGTTWTNISGTLPNIPVNCIAFEPGSSVDALYIGTDMGVYYRDDILGYWIPFRNGLPNVGVTSLYVNVGAYKITAGTFGRGIWTSDLYSSCIADYYLTPANNPGSGGFQRYTASNHIESSRVYLGGAGTDVSYNAGNTIHLISGFHFDGISSAKFRAYISGCPPTPAGPVNPLSGIWAGTMSKQSNIPELNHAPSANKQSLLLYPNPAADKVNISFTLEIGEEQPLIELKDASNKVVKRITLNKDNVLTSLINTIEINLAGLNPGVYFCSLKTNEKTKIEKLVILR